jgi:hypothetical protein
VHRDAAPLYPEAGNFPEPPVTQLAINFPLVDVIPSADNGPTEIANGTHLLSVEQGKQLNASAEIGELLEPVWMDLGDLIIRDVRGLHRGTPNNADEPREMVVMGYSRAWLRRPEVGLRMKESLFNELDNEGQMLLRFEEKVPDAEWEGNKYSGREKYDSATLQKTSGSSYLDESKARAQEGSQADQEL